MTRKKQGEMPKSTGDDARWRARLGGAFIHG
jgi:hypothetical protein